MGNCSTCFNVPPPSEPYVTGPPQEKDKEEIMSALGPAGPVASQASHRSLPPPSEAHQNGSVRPASKPPPPPSEPRLNALFDVYKDPTEDTILAPGMERLCHDLRMPPEHFHILLLAWKLNAEQMCRFTRAEFVTGCREMSVDSIRGLQARLPEIQEAVTLDPVAFKSLYRFTFRFGVEAGQRVLAADMAICLWRLVFTVRTPPVLERWLGFLEANAANVRGIPKDTWNMFLYFADTVGTDLSCYDDAEAWPSLFDEYVEYENGLNDLTNQNVKDK